MCTDKSFTERLIEIGKHMELTDDPFECSYDNKNVSIRMQRFEGRGGKVTGLKVEILDESLPDNLQYFQPWMTLMECPTPIEGFKVFIPRLEKHGVYIFDDPSMDETGDRFFLQKEFPKPTDFEGEYLMVCEIHVVKKTPVEG